MSAKANMVCCRSRIVCRHSKLEGTGRERDHGWHATIENAFQNEEPDNRSKLRAVRGRDGTCRLVATVGRLYIVSMKCVLLLPRKP